MIDERHEELAALYALDLLEGAEKTAFEATLARDAALQALVKELRESSSALAHAVPAVTPPPELKARLLAEIGARPSHQAAKNKVIAFPSWIPWAAAACFAMAAAWTGQLYLTSRSAEAAMRDQQALADITLKNLQNQLEAERIVSRQETANLNRQIADTTRQLADAQRADTDVRRLLAEATGKAEDTERRLATARAEITDLGQQLKTQGDIANLKITTLASMLKNSPEALAVAVWDPAKQQGIFTAEKMPAAAADQDYELWVIDPQRPTPVSAGVFAVGADGLVRVQFKTEAPVGAVAKFAVSREKKGGAPAHGGPKGDVVLISQ